MQKTSIKISNRQDTSAQKEFLLNARIFHVEAMLQMQSTDELLHSKNKRDNSNESWNKGSSFTNIVLSKLLCCLR